MRIDTPLPRVVAGLAVSEWTGAYGDVYAVCARRVGGEFDRVTDPIFCLSVRLAFSNRSMLSYCNEKVLHHRSQTLF